MTQRELRAAVERLLVGHERIALGLDFDGTLAPIVQDPDEATLPAGTRHHLVTLAENPAVDIAVISGRALEDIRSRVDVPGIDYAGNHGFELHGDRDTWVHPAVERHRPVLERAHERLQRDLESVPGCFVEDKHATLTVHHRQAGTDDGSFVIATVQAVVDEEDDLSMVVDDQSVEIRPAIDHHKGDAVRELIDAGPETLVLYFGDAETDIDAFRTLAGWDGETVHVAIGDELPASGHHLESPAAVERFLRWLRIELGDAGA